MDSARRSDRNARVAEEEREWGDVLAALPEILSHGFGRVCSVDLIR